MANAPNTNSTLYLPNGVNKTSTALSTNIIIMVEGRAIGAIQSLQIQEQREIGSVVELGTDGIIDSAPTKSTTISGNCTRVRFDKLRIAEAFGRGFLHAKSQTYPFDIVILDKQKRNVSNQISTVIKNVWIRSISTTYSADNWIISDSMDWVAEDIWSVLNGGTNPTASGSAQASAATGGDGEIGVISSRITSGDDGSIANVEQVVDTGGRRGAMDISGLIDLAIGNNLF